jgi:hypothetical protein
LRKLAIAVLLGSGALIYLLLSAAVLADDVSRLGKACDGPGTIFASYLENGLFEMAIAKNKAVPNTRAKTSARLFGTAFGVRQA